MSIRETKSTKELYKMLSVLNEEHQDRLSSKPYLASVIVLEKGKQTIVLDDTMIYIHFMSWIFIGIFAVYPTILIMVCIWDIGLMRCMQK